MAGLNQTDVEITAEVLYRAFAPEGFYLEMGCIGIIIYEYMLTFEMERKVIWGRRLTMPGILFYLNRYLLLAFAASIYAWGFITWRSDTKLDRGLLQTIVGILLEACYTAFSALRVHAINDKKWFWTILVILTGSVPIPLNIVIVVLAGFGAAPPPLRGCVQIGEGVIGLQIPAWKAAAICTTASVIVTDVLVLGITWYRTAGIVIAARKVQMDVNLVSLMLRDGTVFFALQLALHIIQIAVDVIRETSLGIVVIVFMSITMTRFLLHLRMLDYRNHAGTDYISRSATPTMDFRFSSPIFDNIGAPLDLDDAGDGHGEFDYDRIAEEGQQLVPGGGSYELGEYSSVPRRDSFES